MHCLVPKGWTLTTDAKLFRLPLYRLSYLGNILLYYHCTNRPLRTVEESNLRLQETWWTVGESNSSRRLAKPAVSSRQQPKFTNMLAHGMSSNYLKCAFVRQSKQAYWLQGPGSNQGLTAYRAVTLPLSYQAIDTAFVLGAGFHLHPSADYLYRHRLQWCHCLAPLSGLEPLT